MRTQFVLFVLAAAWGFTGTPAGAEGDRKGLDQLQGSWEIVKADPTFEVIRLTFRGDTIAMEFKDPQHENQRWQEPIPES